ncbi:hypothetical protein HZS_2011 [Henneguya salminicola]|nr:hypothetical protein HZS_2011 [Henneguya salminicola]
MEREFFAIFLSLNHFKNIIFNAKILVKTDNKNLTFNPDMSSKRVQNWKLLLSEFDYELPTELSRNFSIRNTHQHNYNYKEISNWQKDTPTASTNIRNLYGVDLLFDDNDKMIIPEKHG